MRIGLALALCLVSLGWAFSPARAETAGLEGFAGLSGELRIVGCEPGLVVMRRLSQMVTQAHPDVRITVTPCPMASGLSRVRSGSAQLAMFDREPQPGLLAQGRFLVTPYAVDPVAVAVNPVNPVDELSIGQVRDVFAGRVRGWNELGGRADFVLPVIVDATVGDDPAQGRDTQPKLTSQPALRLNLTRNKEIVALVSVRDLEAAIKPLRLSGVEPTRANFLNGSYPVYRLLRLVGDESPSGLAKAFLDLVASPVGQRVVEESGYVALAAKPAKPSPLGVDAPEGLLAGR